MKVAISLLLCVLLAFPAVGALADTGASSVLELIQALADMENQEPKEVDLSGLLEGSSESEGDSEDDFWALLTLLAQTEAQENKEATEETGPLSQGSEAVSAAGSAFQAEKILRQALDQGVHGLSDDELLSLREAAELEYAARTDAYRMLLNEGVYEVGQDVPAGTYTFIGREKVWCGLVVYTDRDGYEKKYQQHSINGNIFDVDIEQGGLYSLTLKPGNILIVRDAAIECVKGNYRVQPIVKDYTVPQGTTVPTGVYTVGKDLPVSSYRAYYNGSQGATIKVYTDQDHYERSLKGSAALLTLPMDDINTDSFLSLKEGNVVWIQNSYVIMTKESTALNFD